MKVHRWTWERFGDRLCASMLPSPTAVTLRHSLSAVGGSWNRPRTAHDWSKMGLMATTQRRLLWIALTAAAILCVSIGICFVSVGLNEANQWAGIFGFFLNVAGVGIGGWTVYSARRDSRAVQSNSPQPSMTQSQRSGNNSINIQSARDLNIGDSNSFGGND